MWYNYYNKEYEGMDMCEEKIELVHYVKRKLCVRVKSYYS